MLETSWPSPEQFQKMQTKDFSPYLLTFDHYVELKRFKQAQPTQAAFSDHGWRAGSGVSNEHSFYNDFEIKLPGIHQKVHYVSSLT